MMREHQSQSCVIYTSDNTHELVCVPLSSAKSEASMNSPSKATFIVTVSEDIDHCDFQNTPDPVSESVS